MPLLSNRSPFVAALAASISLAGLGSATAETMTYGPFLARGLTPDTMIVRWGTKGATDPTRLKLRQKGQTTFAMTTGAAARDHEVIVTGLKPSTIYEYSVESGTASSATFSFATCPAAGDKLPLDLVFYGDSRDGPTAHARLLDEVKKRAPDMVFESGDIAPSGGYTQYLAEFFPATRDLFATVPFMAAPGNHDATSGYDGNYGAIFPSPRSQPATQPWTPYYSFVCGNSQFIALDSNDVQDSDQTAFLEKSLGQAERSRDIAHVFVWFHHAPYSPGSHGDDNRVIAKWVPLFRDPKNKVTAVFSGHDHVYARMNDSSPVLYVVSGGAGAPLYSDSKQSRATKVVSKSSYNFVALRVTDLTVSGVAYNDTGVEIDRFSLTKPRVDPPVDDGNMMMPKDDSMDPLPKMAGEGGCSFLGFGAGRGMQKTSTSLVLLGSLGILLCGAFLRRRARQG